MTSIKEYKSKLKAIGAKTTHANKDAYQKYMVSLEWYKTFPWREEQTLVFKAIDNHPRVVVQGIFGVGKSTMLIGIIFKALLEQGYKPKEIMYTAFNVCVKNEIRKKFSSYGIRNKIQVFTFDSLIYKICKIHNCPNLDDPNYEGRRKFVYNLVATKNIQISFNFKLVVLDECQDLEIQALGVFTTFFPKAKFIFMGDVLQSIQKEPRESLLWQLVTNDKYKDMWHRVCMYETPRVPVNILNSLRHALSQFYPEFKDEFGKWTSKNKLKGNITWHQFKNYKQMFTDVVQFITDREYKDVMVLTFSSSVTVRGALGDVSRIRNLLCEQGIPVNYNHKSMDADKVFLSTSNSSKGLERKHVLVILTFPLEQAFLNFSSDLVMNLVTVALSRAIETVTIYVPITIQKFSPILKHYQNVPEPSVDYTPPSQKGKPELIKKEFNMDTVMNKEHSATEILRLGVLKYETLAHIKSFAKPIVKFKLSNEPFKINLFTDEKRALAGIFVEHLITTQWGGEWPSAGVSNLKEDPSYKHCYGKLEDLYKLYSGFTHAQSFASSSIEYQMRALHVYSQLALGINHRIFVSLSEADVAKISSMWKNHWKAAVMQMKTDGASCKIQSNCKMPFMTGIIDMLTSSTLTKGNDVSKENNSEEGKSFTNCTFWEIKASTDPLWESDALSQAMLYVLMNAKARCTVVLINPFRNQVCKYAVHIPNINTVRHLAMHDCVIYNANSLMAKTFKDVQPTNTLDLLDSVFINIQDYFDSKSITVLNLFSPTKINIVQHVITKGKDSKLGLESIEDFKFDANMYKDKTIYINEECALDVKGQVIPKFEYQGELFNTNTDPFMQAVGNVLHLFTTTKFVF
jgi:superfamily I DNA/RNA helicase